MIQLNLNFKKWGELSIPHSKLQDTTQAWKHTLIHTQIHTHIHPVHSNISETTPQAWWNEWKMCIQGDEIQRKESYVYFQLNKRNLGTGPLLLCFRHLHIFFPKPQVLLSALLIKELSQPYTRPGKLSEKNH